MRIRVPNVRFTWAFLGLPKHKEYDNNDGSKTVRSELTCIIEPDSDAHKIVEDAIQAVAEEKWGQKASGVRVKLRADKRDLLMDGNANLNQEGEVWDGFQDMLYFRPFRKAEKGRVRVLNANAVEITPDNLSSFPLDGDGHPPRWGDFGTVQVNIWAQDHEKGGKRINAELEIVMVTRDGDPLGTSQASGTEDTDLAAFAASQGVEVRGPSLDDVDAGGLSK